MQRLRSCLAWLPCAIGMYLLGLNLLGVVTGLRNDAIERERPGDITLSADAFMQRAAALDGGNRPAALAALNRDVNAVLAHYWLDEGLDRYAMRVPWRENYMLRLLSILNTEDYLRYEFINWRRAVERGIGLCSQHALVAAEVLREHGIPARMIKLTGHVVLTAQVDAEEDRWWVLDPDYGVVLPYALPEIEAEPRRIAPHYAAAGYTEQQIEELVAIFGKLENSVQAIGGGRPYYATMWWREEVYYAMKWLIPLLLIGPRLCVVTRGRRGSRALHAPEPQPKLGGREGAEGDVSA